MGFVKFEDLLLFWDDVGVIGMRIGKKCLRIRDGRFELLRWLGVAIVLVFYSERQFTAWWLVPNDVMIEYSPQCSAEFQMRQHLDSL